MLLFTKSYTQSQLAERLGLKRQNVHRCVKELEEHGYISVDRIEGRNKFIKANTSVKDIHNIDEQSKGQLTFNDDTFR